MSTDLQTIGQSSVHVRFKEPFLSEAINRAQFVLSRGVHRGFNLGASATPLTVLVEADPASGDSVAVVHDIDNKALTIRLDAAVPLDLTAFASKTVAIAVFASHLTQGTTVAVLRGYEILPVDELTGDPNEDNLIVLGTVVVPAAGVIAASSITHQRRVTAGDNVFAQATRVPVVYNHDFAQAYEGAAYAAPSTSTNEAGVLWLANRWTARGTAAAASESTLYLADGTGLTVRTDGSGDYGISVVQDIGAPLGDLGVLTADWRLEIEVTYDVLSVEAGATASVFCTAVAQGEPTRDWEFSVALDLTATGTDLVAAANISMPAQLDTLAAVALSAAGPAVLSGIQISGALAGGTATTDVLKIKSVQAFIRHNPRTAGYKDPDVRIDAPVVPASLTRLLSFIPHLAATIASPQWRYDVDPATAPRMLASGDNPRFASLSLLQIQNAILGTVAPIVIEGWLTGTQRDDPRLKTLFDESNAFTTIWEAAGNGSTEPSLRAVASPSGLLYLTANAKPTAGVWDKDVAGQTAVAFVLNGNGNQVEVRKRAAGAGTWTDAQWTSVTVTNSGFDAVLTDGTTTPSGDVDGVDAVDEFWNGTDTNYKLRRGTYTVTNGITGDSNPTLIEGALAASTTLQTNDAATTNHLRVVGSSVSEITVDRGASTPAVAFFGARDSSFKNIDLIDTALFVPALNSVTPSTFSWDGGSSTTTSNNTFTDAGFSTVIQLRNVTQGYIRNVTFTATGGASSTTSRILDLLDVENVVFENCTFTTSAHYACVQLENTHRVTFKNCRFVSTYSISSAVRALVVADSAQSCSDVVFDGCYFFTASGWGVDLSANPHGIAFRNCKFESGDNLTIVTAPVLIFGQGSDGDPSGRFVMENCSVLVGDTNRTTGGGFSSDIVIKLEGVFHVDGLFVEFTATTLRPLESSVLRVDNSLGFYLGNVEFDLENTTVTSSSSTAFIVSSEPNADSVSRVVETFSIRNASTTGTTNILMNFADCTIRGGSVVGLGAVGSGSFSRALVVQDDTYVENFNVGGVGLAIPDFASSVFLVFGDRAMFKNCTIRELPLQSPGVATVGWELSAGTEYCLLDGCAIATPVTQGAAQLILVGTHHRVVNCTFNAAGDNAAVTLISGATATRCVFANNVVTVFTAAANTIADLSGANMCVIGNSFLNRNTGSTVPTVTYNGGGTPGHIGGDTLNVRAS